jgi:hypothetical protein
MTWVGTGQYVVYSETVVVMYTGGAVPAGGAGVGTLVGFGCLIVHGQSVMVKVWPAVAVLLSC